MAKKNYEEEIELDVIESKPVFLFSDPKFFEFCASVSMMDVEVDIDALTEEFSEDLVRSRKGDYGKVLKYIPSKFIRERLNSVLGCKWSFVPVVEQRVSDPLPKYDKKNDEYVETDKYIKVLGLLIIPGLGVQAQYGVKKTYGYGEADNWKAACTDAFKKCCSAFGIEADYDIEDMDDDESEDEVAVDLSEIEYDEDELEEALETEVTFGKYKELSLEEIYEEDPEYLEWLSTNAREKDLKMSALIVLKHFEEESDKKKKKKNDKKSNTKSGKSSDKKKNDKKSSKSSKGSEKAGASSKKKKSKNSDEDEKKEKLIADIEEIFEEDEEYYDEVTIQSLIQSVSISKKYPEGKEELEELSLKELENLAETLMDDEDDDE